jgi:hypothetical protein
MDKRINVNGQSLILRKNIQDLLLQVDAGVIKQKFKWVMRLDFSESLINRMENSNINFVQEIETIVNKKSKLSYLERSYLSRKLAFFYELETANENTGDATKS